MMRSILLLVLFFSPLYAKTKVQIDSINALGNAYILSNIVDSKTLFKTNLLAAQKLKYATGEAAALSNLGLSLYLNGAYDESLSSFLKAIRIYEKLDMPSQLSALYGEMGYQMKRRDIEKSRFYMKKGISIAEAHKLSERLSGLYDNYGVVLQMSHVQDSALFFYNKALSIKKSLNDTHGIPFTLNHLASVYTEKKEFVKAKEYLQQSDRYRAKEIGGYGRIVNLLVWGDLFLAMGQLDSAATNFSKATTMPGAWEHPQMMSYSYRNMAKIYEQLKNYRQAYFNQINYTTFKDSVLNLKSNARIAKLEIEYETEKKDRQLAQNQLKIESRNQQLFFLIIGIGLVLTFGIFWIIKNRRSILVLRKRRISHYRLLELLGSGGMGEVFKALDLNTSQEIALKLHSPHLHKDGLSRQRMITEGQTMKALRHTNIVQIFEYGETRDQSYIAMEYLPGGTLLNFIEKNHPIKIDFALELTQQICSGLEYIHKQGIIHRDLTSGNILLDENGAARITDFGLARTPLVNTMTTLGTAMGTLGFIAPEQITGVDISAQTDIFSLGVVLYNLFTNKMPFYGENEMALIHAIFNTEPIPPTHFNSTIPVELEAVILRCLSKNKDARFATVNGMNKAIKNNLLEQV